MERLYDSGKLDVILPSQVVASTTVTGEYLDVSNYRSIAVQANVGAMATGNTVALQLTQAKDREGTDVKNVTGVSGTITANVNVNEITITLVSVGAGETLVVNGLTFTGHLTTTTVANREFSLAGSNADDAAQLAICLNDPVYGVPNANADVASNVITLSAHEDEGGILTAVGDTGITVATLIAHGFCEISIDLLDADNGFSWVGISATTNASIPVGLMSARIRPRYTPNQNFAALYLGV